MTAYLTYEQKERRRRLKEKTGAPATEFIRPAIDQYPR
jgi:predicted DNA-binding protein